jgi:hypothetical protein
MSDDVAVQKCHLLDGSQDQKAVVDEEHGSYWDHIHLVALYVEGLLGKAC